MSNAIDPAEKRRRMDAKHKEDHILNMIIEHTKIMSNLVGGESIEKILQVRKISELELLQEADIELVKFNSIDDVVDMLEYLKRNDFVKYLDERVDNVLAQFFTL